MNIINIFSNLEFLEVKNNYFHINYLITLIKAIHQILSNLM